jgi:hypothetical protein
MTIETGWSSPSYGVRHDIDVIVISVRASIPQTAAFRFGLVRLAADRLRELVELLPSQPSVMAV